MSDLKTEIFFNRKMGREVRTLSIDECRISLYFPLSKLYVLYKRALNIKNTFKKVIEQYLEESITPNPLNKYLKIKFVQVIHTSDANTFVCTTPTQLINLS